MQHLYIARLICIYIYVYIKRAFVWMTSKNDSFVANLFPNLKKKKTK